VSYATNRPVVAWQERVIRPFAQGLLRIAAVAVLFSVVIGALDVVGRNIFDFRIPGVVIMTQLAMVVIVFAPLTRLQLNDENLAVSLFYDRLSYRTRALIDVVITVTNLAFFGLLAWGSVRYLMRAIELQERTVDLVQIPLWPIKSVLATSLVLISVHLLGRLWEQVAGFGQRGGRSSSGASA